jgi:hypothetical protein
MGDCCVETVDKIVRWAREEAQRLRGAMRDGRSVEGRHAASLDHFADMVERGDWQTVDEATLHKGDPR